MTPRPVPVSPAGTAPSVESGQTDPSNAGSPVSTRTDQPKVGRRVIAVAESGTDLGLDSLPNSSQSAGFGGNEGTVGGSFELRIQGVGKRRTAARP